MNILIKVSPSKVKIINNVRTVIDKSSLKELSISIKENGLLQPITVKKGKKTDYELVLGQRRLLAARLAKMKTIDAILVLATDDQVIHQVIENTHRKELTDLEEARAYIQMHFTKKMSIKNISIKTNVPTKRITNLLLAQNLHPTIIELVESSKINLKDVLVLGTVSMEIQEKFIENESQMLILSNPAGIAYALRTRYLGNLAFAQFDTKDKTLIPERGSCTECKLKLLSIDLFDSENIQCLDRECFIEKHKVSLRKKINELKEKGEFYLITEYLNDELIVEDIKVLNPREYIKANKEKNIKIYPALVVQGNNYGKIVSINLKKDVNRANQKEREKLTKEGIIGAITNSADEKYHNRIMAIDRENKLRILENYKRIIYNETPNIKAKDLLPLNHMFKLMKNTMQYSLKIMLHTELKETNEIVDILDLTTVFIAISKTFIKNISDYQEVSDEDLVILTNYLNEYYPKEMVSKASQDAGIESIKEKEELLEQFKKRWSRTPLDL